MSLWCFVIAAAVSHSHWRRTSSSVKGIGLIGTFISHLARDQLIKHGGTSSANCPLGHGWTSLRTVESFKLSAISAADLLRSSTIIGRESPMQMLCFLETNSSPDRSGEVPAEKGLAGGGRNGWSDSSSVILRHRCNFRTKLDRVSRVHTLVVNSCT